MLALAGLRGELRENLLHRLNALSTASVSFMPFLIDVGMRLAR